MARARSLFESNQAVRREVRTNLCLINSLISFFFLQRERKAAQAQTTITKL